LGWNPLTHLGLTDSCLIDQFKIKSTNVIEIYQAALGFGIDHLNIDSILLNNHLPYQIIGLLDNQPVGVLVA